MEGNFSIAIGVIDLENDYKKEAEWNDFDIDM